MGFSKAGGVWIIIRDEEEEEGWGWKGLTTLGRIRTDLPGRSRGK